MKSSSAELAPFKEQQLATIAKAETTPILFDMSDAGTGKTRGHLEIFRRRRAEGAGPALVIAPKSILKPAWGNDITKWMPGMTYSIAYAHNRAKAFSIKTDVYITNHDAADWLLKNRGILDGFSTCIIDESTAYKNPQAARSKAVRKVIEPFEFRELLTGTPNPNTILELWNQVYLLDKGQRLGDSYWKFRSVACNPVQNGPGANHIRWEDKPGIQAVIYDLISDISIRHKLSDLPENVEYSIDIDLPPLLQKQYEEMREHRMLELADHQVLAPQASAVLTKLLQIASGAIYHGDGTYTVLDDSRSELVMDLIEARSQSVVAFIWKHQRDMLIDAAIKRKFKFGVIDGDASAGERTRIVDNFQAGKLDVIFAHPQSAGHGLTLTAGKATIWTSPTYSLEHFEQFNRRIYRTGQTDRTETIKICAIGTVDERVYAALDRKETAMDMFRELMEAA